MGPSERLRTGQGGTWLQRSRRECYHFLKRRGSSESVCDELAVRDRNAGDGDRHDVENGRLFSFPLLCEDVGWRCECECGDERDGY